MAGNSAINSTQFCLNYANNDTVVSSLEEGNWQVNGLMLSNAILMALVVCIGAYAPRYRRHPLIGFLLLAATTLFLPIVSFVASKIGGQNKVFAGSKENLRILTRCTSLHFVLALVWTGLVLAIGVTTSAVVAGDSREGRTIAPPTEQLVKTIWAGFLTLPTIIFASDHFGTYLIFLQLFVIIFTKLLFKYIAFCKARRSIALGSSPRLIAGYMAQLQLHQMQSAAAPAPALVVMGEETAKREEQPHGYAFKAGMPPKPGQHGTGRLVTLDRVWGLDDMPQKTKDVCFSFALFKLLRCRFAKYTIFESGFMKVHKFFEDTLLRGDDYERAFRVIADELSLIHYYYYSSLPISYSCHLLLPLFSVALSLYTVCYCFFMMAFISRLLKKGDYHRIFCELYCYSYDLSNISVLERKTIPHHSSTYYTDVVPAYLVLAALVLAETRDLVFYICSNWTKVALICNYVNRPSWQRSPAVQKCIAFVFKHCRCKLAGDNWGDEKMNQCSVLVLHPKKFPFVQLPKWKEKTNIPSAVKAAIFETLKRQDLTADQEGNVKAPPPPNLVAHTGHISLSPVTADGKHTAYTILVWHIATSIFEISHPPQTKDPDEEHYRHAMAATHLSCYCAYLVAYCPELLPSDDEWCKKLYKDVSKDAKRVLAKARRAAGSCQQLLQTLAADSKHEVLRNGARLGVKLAEDSRTGWEALAKFWSEMVLYVAPSENLEAHADAIARGGELVTLLWAMLAHAGIVGRLDDDANAAATPQLTTPN